MRAPIFSFSIKTMNRQSGFAIPIAIIIISAFVVGAGSFLVIIKKMSAPETSQSVSTDKDKKEMIDLTIPKETLENKDMRSVLPAVQEKNSTPPLTKSPAATPQKIDEHTATNTSKTPETSFAQLISSPPPMPAQRQSPEFPTPAELQLIPACAGQQFTTTPVDIRKLTSVFPLGNLAPPGHTIPTEHMFFHITPGNATTETIPLSVPADVYLTLIAIGHGFTQDPVDYTLYFTLCKNVIGYYNHVKELSPELEDLVSKSSCMFPDESKETRCNIQTLHKIANGVVVGKVGRLQGNFDFGLIDLRKPLTFANPNRYGKRSKYIQCALDYYDSVGKNALYSLIEREDGKCGSTAQDVIGTLKGNWFYGAARADMGGDWDKLLAFADDSRKPSISVVSIGGIFSSAEKWEFTPESYGTKNRAFSEVMPDGQIYCYEASGKSGRIIVQLTSQTELKIEKQNESCGDQRAFVNPTKYSR